MGKLKYKVGSQFIVFENHQKMSHCIYKFHFLESIDVNGKDTLGWTPFTNACIIGHTNVVKSILIDN